MAPQPGLNVSVSAVACPAFGFEYKSDPNDCQVYYICSSGSPIKISCPDFTVFNDVTHTCDSPENVPSCGKFKNLFQSVSVVHGKGKGKSLHEF